MDIKVDVKIKKEIKELDNMLEEIKEKEIKEKEIKEKIWFDLAIQCHLLKMNYRNLCQLQIYDDIVDPSVIHILDSLIEYGIKYLIVITH